VAARLGVKIRDWDVPIGTIMLHASKRGGLLPRMVVTSSGSSMLLVVDDAWEVLGCLLALLVLLFLAWS
jgi:hypothetical protein